MQKTRKIMLRRETIKTLNVADLRRAAGGEEPTASVGNYCTTVYTGALNCQFVTMGC